MAALRWLGAWDAFNVTEDADLGVRLARSGYVCRMIDSTTYEEATVRLGDWLKQRTRWLKGFMQTYGVHMRAPRLLWRQLGPSGFLVFHVLVFGVIVAALAHPLFYAVVAVEAALGILLAAPASLLGLQLWLLALFNVVVGYAACMLLAVLTLDRRQTPRMAIHVLFMPLYWLLASAAAYRAVVQLARAPFHWEKTPHGVSRLARPSGAFRRAG